MLLLLCPQRQSRATEMKIREEFEKLGRCLKTEEANRLAALKQEEAQRIRLIQMIMEASRDTFSLSDTVKNMEELVTGGSFITVAWELKEGGVHRNRQSDRCSLSPQNFKSSLERLVSIHQLLWGSLM